VAEQQAILIREILMVLSGIEGQYIRVAAVRNQNSASASAASFSINGGNIEELLTGSDTRFETHRNAYAAYDPASITIPNVAEISLLVDLDTADRPLVHQVGNLFVSS
jgi:hypothetical protein